MNKKLIDDIEYIFNGYIIFYSFNRMRFFHINKMEDTKIKELNNIIADKQNKIFILYYMEGCGPCAATRPEWKKIENIKIKNSDNVFVVDIDQIFSSKLIGLDQPSGFPTMVYITNGGKIKENYEDSSIEIKNRTIDSFIEWIQSKTKMSREMSGEMYGGKKNISKRYKTNRNKKRNKTKRNKRRNK
jgi:hypothetical protein